MNPAFDSAWNSYVKDSMPIVAAVIGAFVGGIISGFLVHILTQSREREKWILDNKKQEFRELLSALSKSFESASSSPHEISSKGHNVVADHEHKVIRITYDRLFIVKDVDLDSIRNLWLEAVQSYRNNYLGSN